MTIISWVPNSTVFVLLRKGMSAHQCRCLLLIETHARKMIDDTIHGFKTHRASMERDVRTIKPRLHFKVAEDIGAVGLAPAPGHRDIREIRASYLGCYDKGAKYGHVKHALVVLYVRIGEHLNFAL
jgi:hypothetical protein